MAADRLGGDCLAFFVMKIENIEIEKETNACFKIKAGGKVVYSDPFKIKNPEKADLILITHEHEGHFSLEDIEKVFKEDTVMVIPPVAHPPLLQFDKDIFNLVVIGPGEKYYGDGWEVETAPAYNVNKFNSSGKLFHPREDERIGFILAISGKRIYFAGDTDFVPEMNSIKNIDLALLPVGGGTVMTLEEAARAVETIQPRVAIPMHCTSEEEANDFKGKTRIKVVIL